MISGSQSIHITWENISNFIGSCPPDFAPALTSLLIPPCKALSCSACTLPITDQYTYAEKAHTLIISDTKEAMWSNATKEGDQRSENVAALWKGGSIRQLFSKEIFKVRLEQGKNLSCRSSVSSQAQRWSFIWMSGYWISAEELSSPNLQQISYQGPLPVTIEQQINILDH